MWAGADSPKTAIVRFASAAKVIRAVDMETLSVFQTTKPGMSFPGVTVVQETKFASHRVMRKLFFAKDESLILTEQERLAWSS